MRILVIDDMPHRVKLLWNAGLSKEIEIQIAHGFDQIKFYLENYKYDLVLLDHDMPLMSGPKVVEEFLMERCIPVIVISNNEPGAKKMVNMLEEYAVPVRYDPITEPKQIVQTILYWTEIKR